MATVAITDKDNRPLYMSWHIWTETIQPFDEILEFMNPLGATVAVLPVMENWSIVVRFNSWPWRMKSRVTENLLTATQATIVIWNDASTLFDQTFFDPVTAITFPVLFLWANTVYSMLKIRLSVIFVRWHTLSTPIWIFSEVLLLPPISHTWPLERFEFSTMGIASWIDSTISS